MMRTVMYRYPIFTVLSGLVISTSAFANEKTVSHTISQRAPRMPLSRYLDQVAVTVPPANKACEEYRRKHLPFIYNTSLINPLMNAYPTMLPPEHSYCNFLDALSNGKMLWWFRARNEDIDIQRFSDGYANTIASHLGYQTADYHNFSGVLEFVDNTIIGRQRYNSGGGTSPGLVTWAFTNDPRGARIDQVFIDYNDPYFKFDFKGGRQRIRLDNERFIGSSSWRQIEQVYDAGSVFYTGIPNLNVFYAYIGRVNRVWGPKGVGRFSANSTRTNIANMRYDIWDVGSLVGYGYFLDNEDVPTFSTNTVGLRFNGSHPYRNLNFLYTAEYARQENATNNPVHYRASYTHFAGGLQINTPCFDFEIDGQREELGGQKHQIGGAFITPLASFHSFQGWAELFNPTPNRGVIDLVASASVKIKPLWDIQLLSYYHNFRQSVGNHRTYGNEVDAEIGKDFKYVGVYFDYANFMGRDRRFPNVRRYWVTIKTIPFM